MARRLRPLLVLLLVAAALGGWLGVRALGARAALEDARASLQSARVALSDGDSEAARAAADQAVRQVDRAQSLTGDPVWRVAAAVPLLGNTFAQVRGITSVVAQVTGGVLPAALDAGEELTAGGLRRPDGTVDVPRLLGVQPVVDTSAGRLAGARADLQALPEAFVLGPVRDARSELLGQLDQLGTATGAAQQALRLAPALLGVDRPRSYFVMVQQPGESRGTGGLIGGYAVLRASQGRIEVTSQGSNRDLENGPIPRPAGVGEDFEYEYGGNLALELWQNVNLSPDLPTVARVVTARWRAQSGQTVDGVITLDPTALSLLLAGSGPVPVGGGRQVAPEQLVQYLTVGQYEGVALTPEEQLSRKDGLGEAAEAAARSLTGGGGDERALLTGLVDAVRSGHLRMASDDPALQPGLQAAGVDGALPRGEGPVAYAVVQNATQGKLDSFLERTVTYEAGPCGAATRASTITVQLTNRAPATGLPPYLTIRAEPDPQIDEPGDSAVLLQVYATEGAQLVSAELDGALVTEDAGPGSTRLRAGLEAGLPFWLSYVPLPRDQQRTFVLRLEEPVVVGPARVPEQPLVRPLVRDVRVPECRAS